MYTPSEMRMGADNYLSRNNGVQYVIKDDQPPMTDTVQEFKWLPQVPNICAAGTWEGLIRFYEISNPRFDSIKVDCKFAITTNEIILSIDTSPDGKIIFAALADFTIRAYEIQTGQSMIVGAHETAPARHVFWVQELNVLVSVGMDKKIFFWDLARNQNSKPAFELVCTEIPLVATQGYGDFAYSDRKNTTMITKWDYIKAPQTSMQRSIFQEIETQLKKESQITSIAFHIDQMKKTIALGTVDGRVNVSSIEMNYKTQNLITFKAHKNEEQQGYANTKRPVLYPVSAIGFNQRAPKNWMFTSGSEGNIIFWDLIQKNRIKVFEFFAPITTAAVSEDGKYLIFNSGYDWHKGIEQMGSHPSQVGALQITESNLYYKV